MVRMCTLFQPVLNLTGCSSREDVRPKISCCDVRGSSVSRGGEGMDSEGPNRAGAWESNLSTRC